MFETTEISVYLTPNGDFIGVPRGMLFNKFNEGTMLFEANPGTFNAGDLGTFDLGDLDKYIELLENNGEGELDVNKFTNAVDNKKRFKQFVEVQ